MRAVIGSCGWLLGGLLMVGAGSLLAKDPSVTSYGKAIKKTPDAFADEGPFKTAPEQAAEKIDGRELFTRDWLPNDSRAHGGDGLGPAYNETSCSACHNMGCIGGAGGNNHNVQVLTARMSINKDNPLSKTKALPSLNGIHSGFEAASEFVLHKYGTDPKYAEFRQTLLKSISPTGRATNVATDKTMRENMERVGIRTVDGPQLVTNGPGEQLVMVSQRNATALFGVGLIDTISDDALLREEKRQQEQDKAQAGRVTRLSGGKLGRFGWKCQSASLEDFTSLACANELGLSVPDHKQAKLPTEHGKAEPKLDMTQPEVLALVSYLRKLPRPIERIGATPQETEYVSLGKKHFETVGCAFCHTPNLDNVQGLYSDLLLHDITPEVTQPYYGIGSGPNGRGTIDLADIGKVEIIKAVTDHNWSGVKINILLVSADKQDKLLGSLGPEWRTPPLWGCRDSGPYLHDGQAETLEQAIAMHGGQAKQSSLKFFQLSATEQQQLIAFLKSLSAPDPTAALAKR